MQKFTLSIVLILFIITVQSCKQKEQTETTVEQTDSVSTQPQEPTQPAPETSSSFVQYNGASDDEIKRKLEAFSPLTEILSLASQAIKIKDSLYSNNMNNQGGTIPPKDSVLFNQQENKTYKTIVAYKKMLLQGPSTKDACPSLMQLTRDVAPGDSSVGFLPQAGRSQFFSQGNFFFLGGAPFIGKLQPPDEATFTDASGKPETRFTTDITENGNFFLNSIYHFKNLPTEVTFGPPLRSYYGWSREVHSIGSLIHRFTNRLPVFLLTEEGVVSGSLSAVTIKLVPENLGCISDQPIIEFACSKSIEAQDILVVYIPYTSSTPTSCIVTRNDNRVWTADRNGDGVDDIACVSGSYMGMASGGIIAESLWFVNIDGQWKIIDAGENLDCT